VKRSVELAVLSREHHVALEIALRLRRATDADAESVKAATLDFWHEEGREHFRLEEELLLPAFARHAPADDADVVRVLVEHVEIRRRIADLETGTGADGVALNALGELLNEHVRHEERTLFGRIEEALEPDELAALGAALEAGAGTHRR
jgi:hemerythrin-like domain-containing protein